MQLIAFKPVGATQNISGTTTSASATIGSNGSCQVLVYNSGTTLAFVVFGVGAATATSAGTPVPPGAVIILTKNPGHDTIAAIMASGTAAIYVQVGEGV